MDGVTLLLIVSIVFCQDKSLAWFEGDENKPYNVDYTTTTGSLQSTTEYNLSDGVSDLWFFWFLLLIAFFAWAIYYFRDAIRVMLYGNETRTTPTNQAVVMVRNTSVPTGQNFSAPNRPNEFQGLHNYPMPHQQVQCSSQPAYMSPNQVHLPGSPNYMYPMPHNQVQFSSPPDYMHAISQNQVQLPGLPNYTCPMPREQVQLPDPHSISTPIINREVLSKQSKPTHHSQVESSRTVGKKDQTSDAGVSRRNTHNEISDKKKHSTQIKHDNHDDSSDEAAAAKDTKKDDEIPGKHNYKTQVSDGEIPGRHN